MDSDQNMIPEVVGVETSRLTTDTVAVANTSRLEERGSPCLSRNCQSNEVRVDIFVSVVFTQELYNHILVSFVFPKGHCRGFVTYNNGGSDQARLHSTAGRGEVLGRLDFIVEALENVCKANL